MGPDSDKPTTPARRLSLDLSPRNRTNAAAGKPLPKATPQTHARAAGAEALHSRVKPSRVLDLRMAPAHIAEAHAAPQPKHDNPASAPNSTTHARHQARFSDRFEQARQVSRSTSINKFASDKPAPQAPILAATAEQLPELPKLAVTHHEAMALLVPAVPPTSAAPAKAAVNPSWRPHLDLSPHNSRNLATAAAVVLMGGYIWLQNYPKLALQSANNKAGLAASMPAFLPSSYNLKSTDTVPGLVTLNFTSPSASEALKIAQARTTWDSSSLLDNFVAKNTDDYATVQGQGLTIYLFNNNHVTWVNHGIWYSIEGASRLSREQILKIAYSL